MARSYDVYITHDPSNPNSLTLSGPGVDAQRPKKKRSPKKNYTAAGKKSSGVCRNCNVLRSLTGECGC